MSKPLTAYELPGLLGHVRPTAVRTPCPDIPDTPAYYAEVAHQFGELADYVRNHPEIDRTIADHLKDFADGILSDVG